MITISLPKLGESILGATVVQLLKKEGEEIAIDEPLLEVATDKVNSEIPSPVAGVIEKILVEPNQELEIGAPLAQVRTDGEAPAPKTSEPEYQKELEHHEASSGFISPGVLRLCRERKLPLEELDHIHGTGQNGRITKRDVENYITARWGGKASEDEERIPMSPIRQAIAENMSRSMSTIPHGYLINEVDVTNLMAAIKEQKEQFLAEHGYKLTITSYLIQAIARAIELKPLVNSSLEGESIIVKKNVNVGIAVAVDDGLIVPVIKKCQDKSLIDIAGAIADLSSRTRNRGLKPDEVSDGSITLTNFGTSGAQVGLPIIRYPEVAIIGVGAILQRGDRKIVSATLSFDHRVLDGMYAGQFLKAFQDQLESH